MIFSKINHKLSLIKYIVIFVPVLTLNLIEINPFITVLQIITLIYLVFEILKNYRKLDFFDALIVFFNLYLFAVSATAGTLTFGIVYSIAILTMLTIYTICELKKSNTVLQAIYVISIVFMLINLYSIALPSTDIYCEVQYFFGGKNSVSILLIASMFSKSTQKSSIR